MESCRYQQLKSSSSIRVCGGGDGGGGGVYSELPPPPVGFRFIPAENHLIGYLQKKLDKPEDHFPLILEKNIYDDDDCHPQQLLESHGKEGVVYLFSPRFRKYPNGTQIRRDTKHGIWKNSTRDEPVIHEGVEIGRKCSFVFRPSPYYKTTHWYLWEYRISNDKSKDEPANHNLIEELAIYELYYTKDLERKCKRSGRKRSKEPSSSTVKLPAKELAQVDSRGLRKVKALPANKLAQGGSRGHQKVAAVYNVQERQLQNGMAQVGNGQAHYNHSHYYNHNEVNYHEKDYMTNEQFVQDIDLIMNSDHYSVRDFDIASLSSTSNMLSLQKDSLEPPMSAFPYSPGFTHFNPGSSMNRQSTHSFYNGWGNRNIVDNHNGLQGGGFAGGGFDRIQYGHEFPPLPDKLVPNYNPYYSSGFTQMYSDIASVPSHAPLKQEYPQELPPY